jgi:hypothetical protein
MTAFSCGSAGGSESNWETASKAPLGQTAAHTPQPVHLLAAICNGAAQEIALVGQASTHSVHVERRCRALVQYHEEKE